MIIAGQGHWAFCFPDGHCYTVKFSATTGEEVERTANGGHGFRTLVDETGPALPTRYDVRPVAVPSGTEARSDPARADCDPPLLPGHTQRLKPKNKISAFIEAELCGPPVIRRQAYCPPRTSGTS